MRKTQTDRLLLAISITGFFLMSISFVVMPFESMAIFSGALFWGGLAAGSTLQIVLEGHRRSFFAKYNVKREKMQKPRNGFLTYGSNRLAVIADIAMILSTVVMILTFIFTKGTGFLCYVLTSTTVFTFCLHCILNGRIYFHINNQKQIRQVLKQKEKSQNKGEGEK